MTLWRRAGGLRGVALAGAIVVALRTIQLLLVGWLVEPDERVVDRLLIWDGGWFLDVAVHGYPDGYSHAANGDMVGNGFAFFPLFPWLIRGFHTLGLGAGDSALLVSALAGTFAGVLIYLWGVALWSRRAGLLFMVLLCAQPMAVVLVMGYTEPLFLMLVAGTFLAAHQRLWWPAGVGGIAAALTRPTGMAVALALAVAVGLLWRRYRLESKGRLQALEPVKFTFGAVAAWRESVTSAHPVVGSSTVTGAAPTSGPLPVTGAFPTVGAPEQRGSLMGVAAERVGVGAERAGGAAERARMRLVGAETPRGWNTGSGSWTTARGRWLAGGPPVTKRELWIATVGAVLALLTGPAFLTWVGWRVGEWDAWFQVQAAGWGSTFDFGQSVWTFLVETLETAPGVVELTTAWLIVGTVVLCAVAVFDRVWPPLLVYGLIALALVVAQAGYWHSKPRLLVPVLLLAAAPVAKGLAQLPTRTAIALVALWSAFGLWFGAYMITIWPFTI